MVEDFSQKILTWKNNKGMFSCF